MFYFVKTPWILKKLYAEAVWDIKGSNSEIFLTFDDGPHPEITHFVLEQLKAYNAKATFFCIGKNVERYPAIYQSVLDDGHRVGNHTQNHLNGWKTPDEDYLNNILEAGQHIQSNLFRPPYGRIRKSQLALLKQRIPLIKTIMWDVLSADFDKAIDSSRCTINVVNNTRTGSIIVFHDSEKAFPRLEKTLPEVLKILTEKGYQFSAIA